MINLVWFGDYSMVNNRGIFYGERIDPASLSEKLYFDLTVPLGYDPFAFYWGCLMGDARQGGIIENSGMQA
jgi:hypothetical protein